MDASQEVFKIGLKGLYNTKVNTDTAAPLMRFNGATQNATKENTSVTFAFRAVPDFLTDDIVTADTVILHLGREYQVQGLLVSYL